MNSITLPNKVEDLLPVLLEVVRRAVDGTVVPIVVDYANQRILIGASSASSTNPGKMEVSGGNLKIATAGKGLILVDANGVEYLLKMDTDGAIRADPL